MFLADLINDLTNNNLLVGLWGRLCLSHRSLHQNAVFDKFTIIGGEAEKVVKSGVHEDLASEFNAARGGSPKLSEIVTHVE
jgi:hypothetical protein